MQNPLNRNRFLSIVLAALLSSPAVTPQSFSTPAAPPWKRIVVPCSAAPNFDLSKGTAFQLTLCASASATTMSNVSHNDGKAISLLVCQDSAGGRPYSPPPLVFGAANITQLPLHCTAQSFMVAGSQLWAVSTGADQSSVPAPSLLQPPLSTATFMPATSSLNLLNETGGVQFSSSADGTANLPIAYGKLFSGTGTVTTQMTFWIEQGDLTATNFYGFVGYADNTTTGTGRKEACGLQYGNSLNQGWFIAIATVNSSTVLGTFGALHFTDANHQFLVQHIRDLNANTSTCRVSSDYGATFHQDVLGPDYFGAWVTKNWGIGGDFIKSSGAKMHLTSLSVNQVP